jgi:hypothetical protein
MLSTYSDGHRRRRGVVALVALTATIALSSAVGAHAEDPADPTAVAADTTPPPAPEATPPAGTYSTPQSVSLASEPEAVIHFTTDGSDPTTASPAYVEPIAVSSSQTIKALAVDAAGNQSAVASHEYSIIPPDTTPPPAPEATPPAGAYSTSLSVGLASEPGASIHYTTDGSEPTIASPTYGEPITVSSSQTIKALAIDAAGNQSAIASHAYTIPPPRPAYRNAVLAPGQGLVSYWRLQETAGTTAADAKTTNAGSYRNGVLLGQTSGLPSDAGGRSVMLDGLNDYINVPDSGSLDTGDVFTLEAWVRRTNTSNAIQTIFAKGSRSYLLRFDANRLKLARGGSGDIAAATVTTTDTAGFHHVVATKSGATVRLYIDGVDRTGAVNNRTISNTSTALNIGRDTDNRRYFPGYVDEAAVYNRALTATVVRRHYEAGIAVAGTPGPEPPPTPPASKLIFSDDFDGAAGAAPNPAKWVAMNWCDKWGSLSCNTNRPQNVALDGAGNLRVSAIRENWNDAYGNSGTWTSGRLETQSKFSFTYGAIMGRIKVPAGQGLWPSFWTTSWNKTGWPPTGEIDMMEALGHEPGVYYCSIHGANSSNPHVNYMFTYRSPFSLAADFHVYEARWEPGVVDFYLDGKLCGTSYTFDLKPFSPQQVLVGMGVGGSWPGNPDATTPSPAEMLVDWVRVYAP